MIQYALEQMIDTYRSDTGKKPAGILLGPAHYKALCNLCKQEGPVRLENPLGLVTQFKGYPVYLKELPGIELMLEYQEAFTQG